MNILLTGASGFIGSHFLNTYRDNNKIRCLKRDSDKYEHDDSFNFKSLDGREDYSGAFEGIDTVVHLAGMAHSRGGSRSSFHSVNTEGTLNLAKQAVESGVRRFIFVSSIGVNGSSSVEPFKPDDIARCSNDYTSSKYLAEVGLNQMSEDTGLEVVIVRPTLVYGYRAPGNFKLLLKFVEYFPVLPFGLSFNKRDFISVQNLSDLLFTCVVHPKAAGHTFLASDIETVSIKEFTNAIAQGLGKRVIQLPIPVGLLELLGKLTGKVNKMEQLIGDLEVDSSNVQEILDWVPPYTMEQSMASISNR